MCWFIKIGIFQRMLKKELHKLIARAIKKSDKSYFFEDYGKQASDVMAALQSKGFVILPKEADSEMCEFAAENMTTGRMRPEEHVGHVWRTMVEFATRRTK